MIADVAPGHPLWLRGDYGRTLDALAEAEVTAKTLVYEEMFRDDTIRELCTWLDLPFAPPDFARRLNVAQGEGLTDDQKSRLRDRLDPVYQDLARRFGADRPKAWQW